MGWNAFFVDLCPIASAGLDDDAVSLSGTDHDWFIFSAPPESLR